MTEDKDAEKKEKKSWWSTFSPLYSFADRVDVQLMLVGVVGTILQAVIPPFVWLTVGNFLSSAMNREFHVDNCVVENGSDPHSTTAIPSVDIEKFDSDSTRAFFISFGLSLAMFVIAIIQRAAWEMSAIRQVFRIKLEYIRKLVGMDVSWLESRHSGYAATILHDHADAIHLGISDNLPMMLYILIFLLVNISLCLQQQWDVTLVMCSAIPLVIIMRILFSKWVCKTLDKEGKLEKRITNLVSETFACIHTVFSFGAQKQTLSKYERLSSEYNNVRGKRLRLFSVFEALCQVLITELVFTLALAFGVYRIDNSDSGKLIALSINLLYMCVNSVTIGFHFSGSSRAKRNAVEMLEILNEAPLIESEEGVSSEEEKKEIFELPSGRGCISFQDVHFSYPSRPDVPVLRGVTFSVEEGEHVVVVGSSGSGKSTLTALMLRFYDPCQGRISLGSVDMRRLRPADLREQCALVSQEPILFDGTIAENIRYGRLNATQLELQEAARQVGAWSFISSLPEGMNTRVGDRGQQLSGGQKQRIAVARAVLRQPKVMIFDEATSALDKKHEEEVEKALDAAASGVTSLTITHRMASIRPTDRVLVLEDGQIVEEGLAEKLLADENTRYYRLWKDEQLDELTASSLVADSAISSPLSKSHGDLRNLRIEPEALRREWARRSLGGGKRLGRSYSVLSADRRKLTLPVITRKRSTRSEYNHYATATKLPVEDKFVDDDSVDSEEEAEKGKFSRIIELLRQFRPDLLTLGAALPVTVIRSLFQLLICYQLVQFLAAFTKCSSELNDYMFNMCVIYVSLILIKTIFEAIGRLLIDKLGHGLCTFLRFEVFRSILRNGVSFFDEEQNTPGRLTHKLISDTATLDSMVTTKLDQMIPAIVCALFGIAVAISINVKMAALCAFQFPVYILVRFVELKQATKRQRILLQNEKKAAHLTSVVLSNMSTIKAYGLEKHFFEVFQKTLAPVAESMRRQAVVSAFVFATQYTFTYIIISSTLYLGRMMMLSNEITLFDYMKVVLLCQLGANIFSQLVSSIADISKATLAAESLLDIINKPPVDVDNLSEEGLRPKVAGAVSMEDVELRYSTRREVAVLKNLSLSISAGESIALVGPSGSGKSSLFALLQRMYPPTQGQVMVDGVSVTSINPSYLRRRIVCVGQEPSLFSFSIRENISFGLLDSEFTQETVEEAAKAANIHEFIISLPKGYDMEVGEFGAQLSGGQKQRIAIARALIRQPAVLLLDEATAALDAVSQKAVQSAIEKASELCTTIIIAHRLSTIRHVNRIFVLVDGGIIEEGSHAELLKKQGVYYQMNQQSGS